MRSDKKFIVKVVVGRSRREAMAMMHNLASMLQVSYDIPIVVYSDVRRAFETPNCIVRYINSPADLLGLKPDEIFGCDPETRAHRRKPSDPKPYDGGILDYILEVEKGAAEEPATESEQKEEYTLLEYLEKVVGLALMEYQKDIVKKYDDDFFKGKCKVVYGRGGKIHVVPVEESNDRRTEEVGRGES